MTTNDLIKKLQSLPIKKLMGEFRIGNKGNFQDWDFEDLETYLKEEKPYIILDIDGSPLRINIDSVNIFDGDAPRELKEIYFLVPEPSLLIILRTTEGWPYWYGGGEYIAEITNF
ncbi:MAG: hypothetical protein WCX46_00635 [Candidatus Paceibacterota bacterium]